MSFGGFYKGKRVLLTGHSGFKGSWLMTWLEMSGAEVLGYSLPPETNPSMFDALGGSKKNSVFGDILDAHKLEKTFADFKPQIVFHLAAQPIVRLSYSEPVLTYKTNVIGTLNVLEAARKCGGVRAFVNVTTDKCYENRETLDGYSEDCPMGGHDMYSSSKGCAEILSASYRRSFLGAESGGFHLATARAGNVIGGGDWAADRLIPDCVRAAEAGEPVDIRNPDSVRPWQHVLEPLSGYMLLAERLFTRGTEFAEGFNFGPAPEDVLTVGDVVEKFVKHYGKGRAVFGKGGSLHEAKLLALKIAKAEARLGWRPTYSSDEAVKKTAEWYRCYYEGADVSALTRAQIKEFEKQNGTIRD